MTDAATPGDTPESIFKRAAERGRQMGLPYAGAVTPTEAHRLQQANAATLVDVRTEPEYRQVGHVPGTSRVEWPRGGSESALVAFVEKMRESYEPSQPLLLICRSGQRSHFAAHVLTHQGFEHAYNVLEGFEGPAPGMGWQAAGLPVERN